MAKEDAPYIQVILSDNIRKVRKDLGYSQQKLAELCEVSTNYIGEIEIARKFPSAKTLQKLAKAMGLKPYQLFFEDGDWERFDRYNELIQILHELQETVGSNIEHIIKQHIIESPSEEND